MIFDWDLPPPPQATWATMTCPRQATRLAGKRVALLVTGGIAAMKTPQIARALRRHGADVTAFASTDALRYVAREALEWACLGQVVDTLTWRAEHLSDDAPFDAYLVAPATHNTIAKMARALATRW